jgi:glc operon protein GlcG
MRHVVTSCLFGTALMLGSAAQAQQTPAPAAAAAPPAAAAPAAPAPGYGEAISLDMAKKVADAAEAEAKKNNWTMAIAIVTPSGDLAYFRRLDNTQYASSTIAQHKAKAAATFKRPTKVFEDRIAGGGAGLAALTLDGIIASEGGVPILVNGKVVGAIGASGGTGQQDGVVANAGAAAAAQATATR